MNNPSVFPVPLSPETAGRVQAHASERGMSAEAVLAELTELWFSEHDGHEEDIEALAEFERTGIAFAWEDVKAWMESWGTENELPKPVARKLR